MRVRTAPRLTCGDAVERVTGIEPAWPAWKAGALPLSYTRERRALARSGASLGNRLRRRPAIGPRAVTYDVALRQRGVA